MGVSTEVKVKSVPITDFQSDKYQIFVGKKVNKSIFRVKGKHMVEFARAIGEDKLKYVDVDVKEDGKPDYSKIVAHPAFANCFVVDIAWDATGWRFPPKAEETEGKLLIPVPSKILHTGQTYDYSNAESAIMHKQKLYTKGYCKEIYVKNNRLWITIHLDTRTNKDQLVVQSELQIVVREGGFI